VVGQSDRIHPLGLVKVSEGCRVGGEVELVGWFPAFGGGRA
jgi:hypothetical protein